MSSFAIKLNKSFDKNLIQEAYFSLNHLKTKPANYPGDGSIAWNSLAVYSIGESKDILNAALPFIADLNLELRLVRFLVLEPGGIISRHVDTFLSGRVVRLHIPVVTHDDVEFMLADLRQNWKEGEFWYGDFTMPHSVHNRSDITRVHLVIDVAVNENLIKLFPEDAIPQNLQKKLNIEDQFDNDFLDRFCCNFLMPAGFKIPGSELPALESSLIAGFKVFDGDFCMFVNDAPMVKAVPVTENKVSVLGFSAEIIFEYTFENDKPKTVTFNYGGKSRNIELV
ncbi:MAG: aspartyl/asparaginyl beta-hydroxylase domain-containing protein [Saprospiraceae bacterium]|nr:aspartyl/asparaginyl beta-hydroxylase domain-containing protein [Saprospiraceae bacterium]